MLGFKIFKAGSFLNRIYKQQVHSLYRDIQIHRLRKIRVALLNVLKFQEPVRANTCEPPESHH